MADTDPVTIIRNYYDAVDDERYDDLVALFTDDVRYERPGQGAITGREELREFYLHDRPLEDGTHEVHDVVVDGSTVAVRGSFSGVQDGDPVEFGFADFHEIEDEKIARRYTFTDRDAV